MLDLNINHQSVSFQNGCVSIDQSNRIWRITERESVVLNSKKKSVMESNSRRRPKSKSKPSSRNPNSLSTLSSLVSLSEPSSDFFPSKSEFLRLLAVVAIAAFVALACSHVFTLINQHPKPFCDGGLESSYSISGMCV